MKTVRDISSMRHLARDWRRQGKTVSLVPTMGYLHEGHLALVRTARGRSDRVVTSIFVNPAQFGPLEDLSRYPRDLKRDARLLAAEGVDCLFVPEASEMYPDGFQTWVTVENLSRGLCGASRPGHFRGVATVVAKLFNIIQPDLAVFGMKDWQQLQVIRRMVRDLDLPVEIVGHPIIREPDGLAMSSRNSYLSSKERHSALSIFRSLKIARKIFQGWERTAQTLKEAVAREILSESDTEIDYIFLGDPWTLEPLVILGESALLAVAVRVGKTRLIDNTLLESGD